MAKKTAVPQGNVVETVVVLQNMGTANHVRLCARPDRQSERVALVKEGETIRYNTQIVRGAPLGEWGDEWVSVQQVESGLNGFIHSAYLVLPEFVPPPPVEDPPAEDTE